MTRSDKETSNDIADSRRRAIPEGNPASNLIPFDHWLQCVGRTAVTGWRWREKGWVAIVNIYGRLFITRDEIRRFEERAAAGEFSKTHKTPIRKAQAE